MPTNDENGATKLACDQCERLDAIRYRQNTQYEEDERNWVTLCPECQIENDEYWAGMWAEYYAMVR